MTAAIEIEPQGEHQYVVRLTDRADSCQTWFHLTPDLLDLVRRGDDDEERVVRRTTRFLLQHQEVADFPAIVELEDVLATYPDFRAFMTG